MPPSTGVYVSATAASTTARRFIMSCVDVQDERRQDSDEWPRTQQQHNKLSISELSVCCLPKWTSAQQRPCNCWPLCRPTDVARLCFGLACYAVAIVKKRTTGGILYLGLSIRECLPKTLWTSYLKNRFRHFRLILLPDVVAFCIRWCAD